jgi:hypothetical protein
MLMRILQVKMRIAPGKRIGRLCVTYHLSFRSYAESMTDPSHGFAKAVESDPLRFRARADRSACGKWC